MHIFVLDCIGNAQTVCRVILYFHDDYKDDDNDDDEDDDDNV